MGGCPGSSEILGYAMLVRYTDCFYVESSTVSIDHCYGPHIEYCHVV